jgi:predicted branched-subunit amino acid permease
VTQTLNDVGSGQETESSWATRRRSVIRNALGIGIATGAYGLSFGAIATAAHLSVWQTCALSLLMFTGASQFALVGVLGGGGSPVAAIATATMLGARNALYGLRLATLLRVRGARRIGTAQLVIDETTAMAVAGEDERSGRLGFYATGVAVFTLWNLGTLVGAVGAQALDDPRTLGLDAAAPAAFLALLAPRLRAREPFAVACAAGLVAIVVVPVVPVGVPVLVATVPALVAGLARRKAS